MPRSPGHAFYGGWALSKAGFDAFVEADKPYPMGAPMPPGRWHSVRGIDSERGICWRC